MKNLLFKKWDFSRKENIFCCTILFFYIVTLFFSFLTDGKVVEYYLFSLSDSTDSYMDLFNSIIETEGLKHANNYPPLALFFYAVLGFLTPVKNPAMGWNGSVGRILRTTLEGSVINLFTILIFSFSLFLVIKEFLKNTDFTEVKKTFIALVILFSGPVIYTVDRGNILSFTLVFLLLFFLYKDNENRKLQVFSYFCLAVAANLKYYPAIFGLLLIKEKKYKDALLCAFFGAFIFGFSLVMFIITTRIHFHESIFRINIIKEVYYCVKNALSMSSSQAGNIFAGSSYTSIQNVGNGIVKFIDHFINKEKSLRLWYVIPSFLGTSFFISLLFSLFLVKEKWISALTISLVCCLCFNSASGFYSLVYLIVPLLCYLIHSDDIKSVSLLFGIALSFVAIPICKDVGNRYYLTFGYIIPEICLILLFAYSVRKTFSSFLTANRKKGMKYIILFTGCNLIILFLFVAKFFYKYQKSFGIYEGNGTLSSPYKISNKKHLEHLRNIVNNGVSTKGLYFIQMDDIDLGSDDWVPIGIYGSERYFTGTYLGNNKKIKNLSIIISDDKADELYKKSLIYPHMSEKERLFRSRHTGLNGLFGHLSGTVRDLEIESGYIAGAFAGGITASGDEKTKIVNCINRATIDAFVNRAGGICDDIGYGVVENCKNYGECNGVKPGLVVSHNAGRVQDIYPDLIPSSLRGIYIGFDKYKKMVRINEDKECLFK